MYVEIGAVPLTQEDIEKLIEGTYPINFDFERSSGSFNGQ